MSGPKSSHYMLSIEMKRQREEERRHKEERRRREEEARLLRIEQSNDLLDNMFKTFQVHTVPNDTAKSEKNHVTMTVSNNDAQNDILQCMQLMIDDGRIPQDLRQQISEVSVNFSGIFDETYRKNFIAIKIKPLIKKSYEYIAWHEENKELLAQYNVVCDLANEEKKTFVISKDTTDIIRAEISRLQAKIADDDEQSYIHHCIGEVMTEMGYDVIGMRDVTKRSGKHFTNKLFSYADGTAVNVTMTDDGQIAMELCGLDDNDRIPHVGEAEVLCRQMNSFCEDFNDLERRLAKKGVVLSKRIKRLPPNAEYSQILNVNDYDMFDEVQYFAGNQDSIKRTESLSKEL